ncbi:DUF1269 domain-containing protein [Nocardioides sp. URHA0020]|uniref:DUF1269 domain-containing protein n=1 Tax=Nocardioides sp. URHA0020 TaxID=1380392 RepID=UPI0018CC29A7|nr:DUF1269 domain-containing protein [Nocardioides sp. URHA0020]
MPDQPAPPGDDNGSTRYLAAPTLTVWIYDSAMGAVAGEVRLKDLRQRDALRVHDAITVSWLPGAHVPRIGHLRRETSAAAARNSLLGGLVDLLLRPPVAGAPPDAVVTALAQRLRGTGIDQIFLDDVKRQLHPESSALLVLSSDVDLDQVRPVIERGLAHGDVILMHARLPDNAPELLREAVQDQLARTQG